MAASNADPLTIATEKTTLPPVLGKTPGALDEKTIDSSGDEVVAIGENEDIIKESDYTPEQYKKLTRKIDRYLLPLMVRGMELF